MINFRLKCLNFKDSALLKYVVEYQFNGNSLRQTVKANQVCRVKNLLTKDKIYVIVKLNCEVFTSNQHSVWHLTEQAIKKHKLDEAKYTDFFRGDEPMFEQTYGRGQFSRSNVLNKSLDVKSSSQTVNKSSSSGASAKTMSKSKSTSNINSNSTSKQQHQKPKTAPNNAPSSKKQNTSTSSTSVSKNQSLNHASSNNTSSHKKSKTTANGHSSEDDHTEIDENDQEASEFALRIVQILSKKGKNLKQTLTFRPAIYLFYFSCRHDRRGV